MKRHNDRVTRGVFGRFAPLLTDQEMKKALDILSLLEKLATIGFYAFCTYAVYYAIFVKQLWILD